jgi:hypothetical protein
VSRSIEAYIPSAPNVRNGWKADIVTYDPAAKLLGVIIDFAAILLLSSSVPPGPPFIVAGTVKYVDGDRLLVACGKAEPCMETIARDERFGRDAVQLQGKKVTLRVQRVDACGPDSTQVACIRSLDGTALNIVEWVAVE